MDEAIAEFDPAYPFLDDQPDWLVQARTRDGYDAACAALGIETRSDREVERDEYALDYANYSGAEWAALGRAARLHHLLGRRRLAGIREERAAARTRPSAPPTRRCARCGAETRLALLMSSADGVVCPDCYDLVEG
jgi:hypothetical protein